MSVEELASDALDYFEVREPREGRRIWTMKDDRPAWIQPLVFEGAHASGSWMPDDYRFAMCVDALGLVAEGNDPDEWEPSIYNADLIAWLGSNLHRIAFVDDALSDYGGDLGVMSAIQEGQRREFQEVYDGVLEWLTEAAELPTEEEIHERFRSEVLPLVIAQYGEDDEPAIREAFNNWTDALCKDGEIADWQYASFEHPK